MKTYFWLQIEKISLGKIYQFSLSTNFDISTATYSNKNLDFASEAVG